MQCTCAFAWGRSWEGLEGGGNNLVRDAQISSCWWASLQMGQVYLDWTLSPTAPSLPPPISEFTLGSLKAEVCKLKGQGPNLSAAACFFLYGLRARDGLYIF